MKKRLLAFTVAIVMALMSTSCSKIANYFTLLGSWESASMTYEDGGKVVKAPLTGLYYIFETDYIVRSGIGINASTSIEQTGTWDLTNNRLTITMRNGDIVTTTRYTVRTLNNNELILEGSLADADLPSLYGTITYVRSNIR